MKHLQSCFLVPHPPIVIPAIAGDQLPACRQTHDAMVKMAQRIAELKPERIILISPHGTVFSDGMAVLADSELSGNLAGFGHSEIAVCVKNDCAFVEQLVYRAGMYDIAVAAIDGDMVAERGLHDGLDHGAIVPLWFIEEQYRDYQLVHINYGLLSRSTLYHFGTLLSDIIEGGERNTVVIASGDLSHALKCDGPYHYHPAGVNFDQVVVNGIKTSNFQPLLCLDERTRQQAAECGYRSLMTMLGSCDGHAIDSQLFSYQGPFGVGYAVAEFAPMAVTDSLRPMILAFEDRQIKQLRESEDDYIRLARAVVNSYVNGEDVRTINTDAFDIEQQTAGCFVSLKNQSGLRGCMGTLVATRATLCDEIIANAIAAASRDNRFNPIVPDELNSLIISVDVLMPAEPIASIDALNPNTYGVIVTAGDKRGVLLPNLEGVGTVTEQLTIAKQKAGITTEDYQLARFEVVRHSAE